MSAATDQIQSYLNSFLWSLPSHVESGIAATADDVRSALTSAAIESCSYPGACPQGVPTDVIDAAVATYAAALQNQVNITGSEFQAGLIANPVGLTPQEVASAAGLYYSNSSGPAAPSNVIPPEASPTSPAFTSTVNVQATAPNSPVAGTASGVGPGMGGSTTIQSPLNPAPGAGPAIAALAPGANTKLYLMLAAVFIVVLLLRK